MSEKIDTWIRVDVKVHEDLSKVRDDHKLPSLSEAIAFLLKEAPK